MSNHPRIVFFGTPAFAAPALWALYKNGFSIVGVVTAPDKPVGRKGILTPSPVNVAAQELGIPVVSMSDIASITPDLGVVVAYGKIIPQSVLDLFPRGVINIHPSALPEYRGPSPIQTAILDGKDSITISLMLLDAEMDHGPVIATSKISISISQYYPEIEKEAADAGAELLVTTLPEYLGGKIVPLPQDHENATYTHKFKRQDGHLDWSLPAPVLLNRIRALTGNPGTWTTLENGTVLNILRAHIHHGTLVPDIVQLAGGTPMDWERFLRGHPDTRLS